jgi:hypothetical protein
MENPQTNILPPPPGIIRSLKGGFDAVASHAAAMLLPIAIDLLLWLGPRLRLDQLARPFIAGLASFPSGMPFSTSDVQQAQQLYNQFFQQFNLLSIIRTFPIGISSLMSNSQSNMTPIGTPIAIQVPSLLSMLSLVFLLTLAGWVGGGLYFQWVARSAAIEESPISVKHTLKTVWQAVLLSGIWLIILIAISVPVLLFISVLALISPILAQGVLFLLALVAMWLILPIFFSPHGIFIREQNAFRSIVSSLQMIRFTFPTSGLFVLLVLAVSQGFNLLWSVPAASSWMTLIGIGGHAFITTGLLAASFIYYRDMSAWLQTVFEQLRTRTAPPPA